MLGTTGIHTCAVGIGTADYLPCAFKLPGFSLPHWHWTAVNWGTVQLSNPVPLRMVPHWRWQGGLAAGRCWAAGCGRCQQLLGDSAARAACVTPAAPRDCFLGGAAAATSCHGSHLTTAHLQGREVCGLQGSCAPGVYP
jgi:hypothetical protein